jgi:hypothetical protein
MRSLPGSPRPARAVRAPHARLQRCRRRPPSALPPRSARKAPPRTPRSRRRYFRGGRGPRSGTARGPPGRERRGVTWLITYVAVRCYALQAYCAVGLPLNPSTPSHLSLSPRTHLEAFGEALHHFIQLHLTTAPLQLARAHLRLLRLQPVTLSLRDSAAARVCGAADVCVSAAALQPHAGTVAFRPLGGRGRRRHATALCAMPLPSAARPVRPCRSASTAAFCERRSAVCARISSLKAAASSAVRARCRGAAGGVDGHGLQAWVDMDCRRGWTWTAGVGARGSVCGV